MAEYQDVVNNLLYNKSTTFRHFKCIFVVQLVTINKCTKNRSSGVWAITRYAMGDAIA